MRLIDADALADALFDKRKNCPQWVADTIGAMPDAIVRCKDCAYALFKEGVQPGHIVCTKPFTEHWQAVKPNNWFCADGVVNCSEFPNSSVALKGGD